MSRDVILSKKASLERCIAQARAYYGQPSQEIFEKDFSRQDAIAINLQRAMELAIDMANHLIKEKHLTIATVSATYSIWRFSSKATPQTPFGSLGFPSPRQCFQTQGLPRCPPFS